MAGRNVIQEQSLDNLARASQILKENKAESTRDMTRLGIALMEDTLKYIEEMDPEEFIRQQRESGEPVAVTKKAAKMALEDTKDAFKGNVITEYIENRNSGLPTKTKDSGQNR